MAVAKPEQHRGGMATQPRVKPYAAAFGPCYAPAVRWPLSSHSTSGKQSSQDRKDMTEAPTVHITKAPVSSLKSSGHFLVTLIHYTGMLFKTSLFHVVLHRAPWTSIVYHAEGRIILRCTQPTHHEDGCYKEIVYLDRAELDSAALTLCAFDFRASVNFALR